MAIVSFRVEYTQLHAPVGVPNNRSTSTRVECSGRIFSHCGCESGAPLLVNTMISRTVVQTRTARILRSLRFVILITSYSGPNTLGQHSTFRRIDQSQQKNRVSLLLHP